MRNACVFQRNNVNITVIKLVLRMYYNMERYVIVAFMILVQLLSYFIIQERR